MTRTLVYGPWHVPGNDDQPWPWAVSVASPGAGVETRRFALRSQAKKYAQNVRAQAAWDEL